MVNVMVNVKVVSEDQALRARICRALDIKGSLSDDEIVTAAELHHYEFNRLFAADVARSMNEAGANGLKSCPFCGSNAELKERNTDDGRPFYIKCEGCYIELAYGRTPDDSKAEWNQRATHASERADAEKDAAFLVVGGKGEAVASLIERLQIHSADGRNTAFSRSTMREVLEVFTAPQAACTEIKSLVKLFLTWPLPQTVAADSCATNSSYAFPRSGANLLNADEAEAMLRYVLDLEKSE